MTAASKNRRAKKRERAEAAHDSPAGPDLAALAAEIEQRTWASLNRTEGWLASLSDSARQRPHLPGEDLRHRWSVVGVAAERTPEVVLRDPVTASRGFPGWLSAEHITAQDLLDAAAACWRDIDSQLGRLLIDYLLSCDASTGAGEKVNDHAGAISAGGTLEAVEWALDDFEHYALTERLRGRYRVPGHLPHYANLDGRRHGQSLWAVTQPAATTKSTTQHPLWLALRLLRHDALTAWGEDAYWLICGTTGALDAGAGSVQAQIIAPEDNQQGHGGRLRLSVWPYWRLMAGRGVRIYRCLAPRASQRSEADATARMGLDAAEV